MHCNKVQRKLSTWSNEPHSAFETRRVDAHLAGCETCRAYRESVLRIDALAAQKDVAWLPAGLGTPRVSYAAVPPQRPLGLRGWAPMLGVGAMLVGVLLALQIRSRDSEPAREVVIRVIASLQECPVGYHEQYWQAQGEHQDGNLTLLREEWHQGKLWRITSAPNEGGDRILRPDDRSSEGSEGSYVHLRRQGETVMASVETYHPGSDPILSNVLSEAGLTDSKANAQSLGSTTLDGQQAQELVIQTSPTQRTYFWLQSGKSLPLRIERQNDEGHGWQTSWMFKFDYAQEWPASVFDPKSLKTDEALKASSDGRIRPGAAKP